MRTAYVLFFDTDEGNSEEWNLNYVTPEVFTDREGLIERRKKVLSVPGRPFSTAVFAVVPDMVHQITLEPGDSVCGEGYAIGEPPLCPHSTNDVATSLDDVFIQHFGL